MWIVSAIHIQIPLQFYFECFLNSGPHLAYFLQWTNLSFQISQFINYSETASPLHLMCCLFWWLLCHFLSKCFYLISIHLLFLFHNTSFLSKFLLPSLIHLTISSLFSHIHYLYTSPNPFIMSSAKSKGSSRRKGKEAIIDKPLVDGERGEKEPHFKSDHSEDDKTTRNTDSECPPLINPWYDTHSHFSVVSSNYLPPPLGRVWLSLEWCDFHTSCALLASSIPDFAIHRGET